MAQANTSADNNNNNLKAPIFDGERFDYWKERIECHFLGTDPDLWDLVMHGYSDPVDARGMKIPRSDMTDDQKKRYKDHYKAKAMLYSSISYMEFEKISDRETAKSIFDSLVMTHEGNEEVKETKALALIKQYEQFQMEQGETIEAMYSRFQTLIAGIRVLNKSYSTGDHVKKIIRSLPKEWMAFVTALKLSRNLDSVKLEELVSHLRSHEIELQQHKPQKKEKSIALKVKPVKAKAYQAAEEDASEESSEASDEELSLLTRKITRLLRKKQGRGSGPKRNERRSESSSGQKKPSGREVTCFECDEPGHYKSDCPKLKKGKKPRKFFKKKALVTFDATDSDEEESEDEAVEALMATTSTSAEAQGASEDPRATEDDSDSDNDEEVFSKLSPSQLRTALSEIIEKHDMLSAKYKKLKNKYAVEMKASEVHEKSVSELIEENLSLRNDNSVLTIKNAMLEEQLASSDVKHESLYEKAFQRFLAKGVDRSLMASMIYGVSRNGNHGIGYSQPMRGESSKPKRKALHKHFVPAGTIIPEKAPPKVVRPKGKKKINMHKSYSQVPMYYPPAPAPKVPRTSGGTNKKGPKKWVPKDKIISVSDILCSAVKTPVLVPGQWMLATHDGHKVYIPKAAVA